MTQGLHSAGGASMISTLNLKKKKERQKTGQWEGGKGESKSGEVYAQWEWGLKKASGHVELAWVHSLVYLAHFLPSGSVRVMCI